MKLNRVSGILSVAVLAGLWGCSSQKQVAQQYVYDDLYANSSDVRAVAYSNKRSGNAERVQPGDESVVTRTQPKASVDEYYSPELSAGNYKKGQPGYSNEDYDAGYADGYHNAQRTSGWNSPYAYNSWNRWNSWNNWGWGGFGGWGYNNWYSPGISIGLGWGRPWGWGGGFYDPFWGGGWGYNNWAYSPYGYGYGYWDSPWGWGRNRIYNNYYYYGNGGGSGNVNNGGTYTNPSRNRYTRSQSAYNSDFDNSVSSPNRAGRQSYNNGSATSGASDYYSRPRRDGGSYGSESYNSYSRPNSGYSNNNSYNNYSRPGSNSNNWGGSDNSSRSNSNYSNSNSSSSFGGGSSSSGSSGGGGGGRSRGPR